MKWISDWLVWNQLWPVKSWIRYVYIYTFKCLPNNFFNTLRPKRNEQHFADNIFKHIFLIEIIWISIKILLKFVPKGPINNTPALVQIMAWRRSGDKPLSEPMIVSLLTHTRPQWGKKKCYVCGMKSMNLELGVSVGKWIKCAVILLKYCILDKWHYD